MKMYPARNVCRSKHSEVAPRTGHTDTFIVPVTLTYKFNIHTVKMELHSKNKVSRWRLSKVRAWTDRQTHNTRDLKHYHDTFVLTERSFIHLQVLGMSQLFHMLWCQDYDGQYPVQSNAPNFPAGSSYAMHPAAYNLDWITIDVSTFCCILSQVQ